jgi:uncharacterized membrane protein
MTFFHADRSRQGDVRVDVGERSRWLAVMAIVVLVFGAVLFSAAWMIGGQDATADNWVGVTTVMALFAGLFGSLAAMVTSLVVAVRHGMSSRLWLPVMTFPTVLVVVIALEAFVFE